MDGVGNSIISYSLYFYLANNITNIQVKREKTFSFYLIIMVMCMLCSFDVGRNRDVVMSGM